MFQKTRLKLTAWYLLIIMLISISFSVMMHKILTNELDRVERVQRVRLERQFPRPRIIDPEVIEETKNRLRLILFLINLAILGFSGIAGYFLAGRTLKPIAQMVDEQNRFITDCSHELRTPLTSLKSETEVALRDKNLSLNVAKKLLESNLEEVEKLQILSDNLIKLTQYQKNNGLTLKKISLKGILNDAIKKVSSLGKLKNITLKNLIKDYMIEADEQSLTEVFVILLDNAVKYSNKNTRVILSSQSVDHFVVVEVKDQGIGIAQEDLPHIFNR